MASYKFDEPFAELVASGRKTQTIRRLHPDVPKVGERLELCQPHPTLLWQLIRDDVVCTSVQPIRFYRDVDGQIDVDISGVWQDPNQVEALARADGFRGVGQFFAYFKRKGLPFKGVLVKWSPAPVAEIHPARYPQHDRTLHPDKGDFEGECNRTACTNRPARYYNRVTLGHYCVLCARLINEASERNGMGHLCIFSLGASHAR